MSTLPEITEALCKAYLRGEWDRFPTLCAQAGSKMGGDRGARIQELLRGHIGGPQRPALKHWSRVGAQRHSPVPSRIRDSLDRWRLEMRHADALTEAGERVQPLLFVGPTRCGKTSTASAIGAEFGLPVHRLGLSQVVGSYMGETATKVKAALEEMVEPAVWLVDELDAVAMQRGADSAADKERSLSVGLLLTALDELPASTPLIATTNMVANIDPAVVARFQVLVWPDWEMLPSDERERFAAAHGCETGARLGSYAEAVAHGRSVRVGKILDGAKVEAAE